MIEYVSKHYDKILACLLEHVQITVIAVAVSFMIALPFGILISKYKRLSGAVNGVCNLIFSIPTLAMLVILLPFTGLGDMTAIVTLVLYNQYVLIKNIAEGFDEINPAIHEIGLGMGYSKVQFFFSVEWPLALPMIINGIKLAAIGTVTMGTLGATIGAGGLGELILMGLVMRHWNKVIVGSVLCAVFAFMLSTILQALEDRARKRAQGIGR